MQEKLVMMGNDANLSPCEGMEKEEETEKHLQDILDAQTKGLIKKKSELVIPTPEFLENDAEEVYDSLYKGEFK